MLSKKGEGEYGRVPAKKETKLGVRGYYLDHHTNSWLPWRVGVHAYECKHTYAFSVSNSGQGSDRFA